MSTRLDLALQELADAAGATSDFGDPDAAATTATVQRLAAQVRRRRAVRGAASTAVAASAAGAVALTVPHLTQDVAPAGDPDAAPGECGSTVAALPSGDGDALDVVLGFRGDDGTPHVDPASAGFGAGTWQGRTADVVVGVSQIPDAGVGSTWLRLLVAQDGVVVGTANELLSLEPTTTSQVLAAELGTLGAVAADVPVYPLDDGDESWWQTAQTATGATRVAQDFELGLSACDGSGALPAGGYQVWATTVDSARTARGAAGPWDLVVADQDPERHALPDGFPTDVPLVDGVLVTAHRHGDGWAAEIVTPGADRGTVAWSALTSAARRAGSDVTAATGPSSAEPWSGATVDLPEWSVRAVASQTPAGEPSVVYVLTPRG